MITHEQLTDAGFIKVAIKADGGTPIYSNEKRFPLLTFTIYGLNPLTPRNENIKIQKVDIEKVKLGQSPFDRVYEGKCTTLDNLYRIVSLDTIFSKT